MKIVLFFFIFFNVVTLTASHLGALASVGSNANMPILDDQPMSWIEFAKKTGQIVAFPGCCLIVAGMSISTFFNPEIEASQKVANGSTILLALASSGWYISYQLDKFGNADSQLAERLFPYISKKLSAIKKANASQQGSRIKNQEGGSSRGLQALKQVPSQN